MVPTVVSRLEGIRYPIRGIRYPVAEKQGNILINGMPRVQDQTKPRRGHALNKRSHWRAKQRARHRTAIDSATWGIFPWAMETYPGITNGMLAILQNRVTRGALRDWRANRRRAPQWAYELIIDYLDNRASELTNITEQLKKEKAAHYGAAIDPILTTQLDQDSSSV